MDGSVGSVGSAGSDKPTRSAASDENIAARPALSRLVFGRPNRLGPALVADLAADLGASAPAGRPRSVPTDAERDRAKRHGEALAAVRELAGRLPTGARWADPEWIESMPGQPAGQCLILAEDLAPDELLARLSGGHSVEAVADDALGAPGDVNAPGDVDAPGDIGARGAGGTRTTPGAVARVALGRIGAWSLAVERGGSFLLRPEALARAGRGTRLVCIQHDGVLRLSYLEDGILVDQFDPLFPERRAGADPGRLDQHLTAAGRQDDVDAENAAAAAAVPFRVAEAFIGAPLTSAGPSNAGPSAAAAEASQTPQTPQTPQAPEMPQIPQTPQTPQAPQTPETPQISQTPQTRRTPEHSRLTAFRVAVAVGGPLPAAAPSRSAQTSFSPVTTPGGLLWWPRPGDPGRPERQRVSPRGGATAVPGAVRAGRATVINPRGSSRPRAE